MGVSSYRFAICQLSAIRIVLRRSGVITENRICLLFLVVAGKRFRIRVAIRITVRDTSQESDITSTVIQFPVNL